MRYVRYAIVAVGLFCVLWGAADATSRLAHVSLGSDAGFVTFAPAVAIDNPALLGTSTPGTITPARLKIPSLGIDAAVEQVGTKTDGSMGTPQNFANAGWYVFGQKPGAPGNAVFAGHVNNALTKPGVFGNLSKIKKGDYLTVSDAAGKSKVYRVSSIQEYAPDASTDGIFAASGPSQVVLITCDGDWDQSAHSFDKRLVVIATLAY